MSPRFVLGRENVPCVAEVVYGTPNGSKIVFWKGRYFLWKGRYFFRDRDTSCEKLPWIRGSKERSSQNSHPQDERASEGGGTSGHPGP